MPPNTVRMATLQGVLAINTKLPAMTEIPKVAFPQWMAENRVNI